MELYEEFKQRKQKGEKLDFESLSPEQLKQLWWDERVSDRLIAELFDVPRSRVRTRRQRLGMRFHEMCWSEFLLELSAKPGNKDFLTSVAKAVTHFAFRNGPVEDLHANGQLSQQDMKILNKFMVNRLAYVFHLIFTGQWEKFFYLVAAHDLIFGHDWDDPELDDGGFKQLYALAAEKAAVTKES
ncbi:hypothetical protein [Desulfofundulus thermosubterraneus]|uniref:Uncharacterized protein n=1 Tax=Desulfofundulus thermosubterraneus DSM 16057 TaxID=1121432 RepID=A0A1M6B0H1_9FIRM|nr:hypothetical protein [Desulfofundulus thermosubterraneus]SHI42212.1 hypothetical protein SAMN02745219_00265 [Desulfofundulus thermosubterraneus DSM 16057]